MKKNRMGTPLAERRGVFQPFNYQATDKLAAILVCADVEKTSGALARGIKAKVWKKNVFDKPIRVEGPFYNPFQLRGHSWTTIIGLLRLEEPPFSDALAQQLSASLKAKVIFFSYEDTSAIVLLLLFDKGELVEVLVNDGNSRLEILDRPKVLKFQNGGWPGGFYFHSQNRRLGRGMLTQTSYNSFVDDFLRRQNAWLCFDGTSSVSGGCATFTLDEGEKGDVLRADLVALKPARILTEAELRNEKAANDAAERSNDMFGFATAPADAFPRSPTQKSREQAMQVHRANLTKVRDLLRKGAKMEDYWLWKAAKAGNDDLAFILIEAGADLNVCPHGSTALETAVKNRHAEIALALIEAGAHLDLKGEWSGPPLLLATATRQTELIRAMIHAGSNVNVRGDVSCGEDEEKLQQTLELRGVPLVYIPQPPFAEDSTALMVAVRCGYPELVTLLLKAGSDLALKDKDGMTAFEWAKQGKNQKIIALLQIATALRR